MASEGRESSLAEGVYSAAETAKCLKAMVWILSPSSNVMPACVSVQEMGVKS